MRTKELEKKNLSYLNKITTINLYTITKYYAYTLVRN